MWGPQLIFLVVAPTSVHAMASPMHQAFALARLQVIRGEQRVDYAWHYLIPYPRIPTHPRFVPKYKKAPQLPPALAKSRKADVQPQKH